MKLKEILKFNNDRDFNRFWVKFLAIFVALTLTRKITKSYTIDNLMLESVIIFFLVIIFIGILGSLCKLLRRIKGKNL